MGIFKKDKTPDVADAEDWGVAEEIADEEILDAVAADPVPEASAVVHVHAAAAAKARDIADLRKKRK